MGFILNIVADILIWVLYPFVKIYTIIYLLFIKQSIKEYDAYKLALAKSKDQFGNVFVQYPANHILIKKGGYKFGHEDEKMSSVIGKNKVKNTLTKVGKFLDKILDLLDKNHSINSIDNTINYEDNREQKS